MLSDKQSNSNLFTDPNSKTSNKNLQSTTTKLKTETSPIKTKTQSPLKNKDSIIIKEDFLSDDINKLEKIDLNKKEGDRSNQRHATAVVPSWMKSIKKVSASVANSKLFLKGDQDVLFCCSVDGSIHSDYAFDMITDNFFNSNSKLLCVHVFYSKLDTHFNYNNRKNTILEKYAAKIERFKKQTHFISEDRVSKIHALEQAVKIAENYSSNYIVCGYQGLKGPRGCNKEQNIGHD